jgi:transposase
VFKVAIRSPAEGGERTTEVLEFRAFYGVLQAMARTLRERGVTHVAMEASGVYTEPVYHALCEQDFTEVLVVNPQHVKALKGHKTDARDCRRIAELLLTQHAPDLSLDVRVEGHEQVRLGLRPLVHFVLAFRQLITHYVYAANVPVCDHRLDVGPQARERSRGQQVLAAVQ